MNLFSVAFTDMDAVIGVIAVILWIVVQLANRKAGKNAPQQPPSAPGEPTSPQDDIRKFFEELEKGLGGAQQETAPTPPPAPPPAAERPRTLPKPPAPVKFPGRPPVPAPVPVPRSAPAVYAEPQPSPAEMELQRKRIMLALEHEAAVRTVRQMTAGPCPAPQLGALREQLRNPGSLRRLIVASEILARPVGFRAPAPPA